jgi:phosphoglucomutase
MSLSRNACLISRCYQKQNQRQVDRLFDVLAKEQNDIDTKYLRMLHSVVERLASVVDVPSAKRLQRIGCRALFVAMAGVDEERQRQALSAYFGMLEEVNRGIAGRVSRLGGNLDTEADREAELKVADAIERYLIVKQVVGKLRSLGEAVTISTPADTTTTLAAAEIIKAELEPIVKAHNALKKRYQQIEKLIAKGIVVTPSSGACPDEVLLFNVANRVRAALSECSDPQLKQAAQAAANSDLSGAAFQKAIEVAMVKTMGARAQDLKIAVVSAVRALDSSSFRRRGDGGRVGNRASRKLDASKSNRKAWNLACSYRQGQVRTRKAGTGRNSWRNGQCTAQSASPNC